MRRLYVRLVTSGLTVAVMPSAAREGRKISEAVGRKHCTVRHVMHLRSALTITTSITAGAGPERPMAVGLGREKNRDGATKPERSET